MRENHAMKPNDTCRAVSLSSLTITLLNTRSLKKHAVDIAADEVLTNSDNMFLTETKVESTDDISAISDILNEFTIIHNIDAEMFCSLACCYKNIDHMHHESFPAVTLYNIQKKNFQLSKINILLTYRKNLSKRDDFIYILNHVLSRAEDNIHIILGDFNINALIENKKLHNCLKNYCLVVDQPTHISASLIDHVYVKIDLYDQVEIHSIVRGNTNSNNCRGAYLLFQAKGTGA